MPTTGTARAIAPRSGERPRWWAPLVLTILINAAVVVFMCGRVTQQVDDLSREIQELRIDLRTLKSAR